MNLNQKDRRVKKILERNPDMTPVRIARKLGYSGPMEEEGIERVKQAIKNINAI